MKCLESINWTILQGACKSKEVTLKNIFSAKIYKHCLGLVYPHKTLHKYFNIHLIDICYVQYLDIGDYFPNIAKKTENVFFRYLLLIKGYQFSLAWLSVLVLL